MDSDVMEEESQLTIDRVELFRESVTGRTHTLNLKINDVKLEHIAKVFKVHPETLYLEEDITKNAEFPEENGMFRLKVDVYIRKYKVCGDDQVPRQMSQLNMTSTENQVYSQPRIPSRPRFTPGQGGLAGSSSGTWQTEFSTLAGQRHIADVLGDQSGPSMGTPLSKRSRAAQSKNDSVVFWKRTIPYVTLGIESNGKCLCVDSTVKNIYVKLIETTVSAATIIAEASSRMSNLQDELILLDSKFIPISADDTTDAEFWKPPSRRFYLARSQEFSKMMKIIKKNRKPLKLFQQTQANMAEGEEQMNIIDDDDDAVTDNLRTINDSLLKVLIHIAEVKEIAKSNVCISSITMPLFECKICKDIPTVPVFVTCCQQLLGCKECVEPWVQRNHSCPLCRADEPNQYKLNGFDELLAFLRCAKSPSANDDVSSRGIEEQ